MKGYSPGRPEVALLVEAGEVGRRVEVGDLDVGRGPERGAPLRGRRDRLRPGAGAPALAARVGRGRGGGLADRRPCGAPGWSADDDEEVADLDRIAHGHPHALHAPLARGAQLVLHLHRLHDEDLLAGLDVVAGAARRRPRSGPGMIARTSTGPPFEAAPAPRRARSRRTARRSGSTSTSMRQPSTTTSRTSVPRRRSRRTRPKENVCSMQSVGTVLLEAGPHVVEAVEADPRRDPVHEQASSARGARPSPRAAAPDRAAAARLKAGSPSRRVAGATPTRTARGSAGGVVAAGSAGGGRPGDHRGRALPRSAHVGHRSTARARPPVRHAAADPSFAARPAPCRRVAAARRPPPGCPVPRQGGQPGREGGGPHRGGPRARAVPVGVDPGRGELGRVDEPRLGQHRPVERAAWSGSRRPPPRRRPAAGGRSRPAGPPRGRSASR